MSKIYLKYVQLKKENNETLYLFKSGLFYIFLEEDAQFFSNLTGLKLTELNDSVIKCGFPTSSLEKYKRLLQNLNYSVQIIDFSTSTLSPLNTYIDNETVKIIINNIINLDIDSLSIKQAFDFLYETKNKLSKIKDIIK